MVVTTSEIGVSGERDEDGYIGRYTIGTQYVFHDDSGFLLALQVVSAPEEIVFQGGRLRGATRFASPPLDSDLFQAAVKYALSLAGVERICMLVGDPVVVASRGGA